LCTRSKPSCTVCPLLGRCVAHATGRVQELPMRKPKKTIPEKQTAMLVVVDGNQVLLEQRPGKGIWGGLLSLPEIPTDPMSPGADRRSLDSARFDDAGFQTAIAGAIAPFGVPASCERLPSFTHVFTHFKLHIAPFRITLARRLDIAAEQQHVWYHTHLLADAPLPAPVKKLLLAMFDAPDLVRGKME
jgi:A/G-specific adenine glycosylase